MKKELRGRGSQYFVLCEAIDIKAFYNSVRGNVATPEEIAYFIDEFGVDITRIRTLEKLKDAIRKAILNQYNNDISATYLFMYFFLVWYRDGIKKLEKVGCEDWGSLIDFSDTMELEVIKNSEKRLAEEYDKSNVHDIVVHLQIKLLNHMKILACISDEVRCFEFIKKSVSLTINNCRFLMLIGSDMHVDREYMLRWEYYPVDRLFRDVIDTFDSELSQPAYIELKENEFAYFNSIKNAKVDFASIKKLNIKKDGKERTVYVANKPLDQAALIYLAKRLNQEFTISYPNRDKIMETCFNLIDSLPKLDDYTIFKFDFKDFFDSVNVKEVYERYLEHSNLYSYEKELILRLYRKFKVCVQGLPTSNALTEIISREFDNLVRATFAGDGLVFYKRYVDDCILIFNHYVDKGQLNILLDECRKNIFGKKVAFSKTKTAYQTKYTGDIEFDYLGYLFKRCPDNSNKTSNRYFEFGIAKKKIEKYKSQLDGIFASYYPGGGSALLLLRRLQYYNSRVVFYNYDGSKYVNKSTWDVRGIINSYRMLRRYVIWEEENRKKTGKDKMPNRIEESTYKFLRYYVRDKRNSLGTIPRYLHGRGCDNHTLWSGFLYNKSIVFQPNIGWSNSYLNSRLLELGISPVKKSYYEKTRDYYTELMKKL